MLRCTVLHPSAAYRRGVGAALDDRLYEVLDGPADPDAADVVLLFVAGDETWEQVDRRVRDESVVVALMPDLAVGSYRRALASGVDGLCDANLPPEMIARAVDAAVAGEVTMPAETARRLATGKGEGATAMLSDEERGLLQRHADGASIADLARNEFLGERTVRRRLQNACVELGARSRPEAIKRATQLGIID